MDGGWEVMGGVEDSISLCCMAILFWTGLVWIGLESIGGDFG